MRLLQISRLTLAVAIVATGHIAHGAILEGGAVAAPDEYSAKVAAQVLKAGGNAVDAAVATAFTLAVTYPEAGNIGGGGFMTLYIEGKPYFLDYREVAPKAASKTMYLDDKGEVIENLSLVGARASGVPGTVLGMWEAHQRFGKLPWSELITPAVGYAREGFTVADQQYQYRDDALGLFKGTTNFEDYFGAMKAGSTFRQPELAGTLERIADKGPDDFYKGKTADLLVAQMQRDDGLISKEDLTAYRVKWREPMRVDWQGNSLYTAPLPSSGGIALAQLIGMKEQRAADFKGVELNSARYIHLLAEIEKRRQTTHFSIVDADGNAVSNTYTLNLDYGSGVVVKGAGFLLNNEMDDFSAKPGVANAFGVVGSDANAIEPGKRMLSSMSPSIVTRDGKVSLVLGTPGGSRIFTSIFQVLNNVYDFDMPLEKAVAAQRVHHQLLPKDTIYYDAHAPLTGKVADELKAMGYTLEDQGWLMGDIQAIRVDGTRLQTGSDPRGRGVGMVVKP